MAAVLNRHIKHAVVGAIFLAASVIPLALPPTPHALAASSSSQGCMFRYAIWHLVQQTAQNVQSMHAYSHPDHVAHDRDALLNKYQKTAARFGNPRGANTLQMALKRTWGYIWDYAYWWNAQLHDPVAKWGVDGEQQYGAVSAAQAAMQVTWSDALATC